MQSFNDKSTEKNQFSRVKKCICSSKSGIFFNDKYISFLTSGLVGLCFFIFITGFFLGKKKAVEKFCKKIEQEALSDTIYSSMCSLYTDKNVEKDLKQENSFIQEAVTAFNEKEKDKVVKDSTVLVSSLEAKEQAGNNQVNEVQDETHYYAELIGFGTKRAANKFAQKLQKKHIEVIVKNRNSKSSAGKSIKWYQVITKNFNDKNDLCTLVDTISTEERLKGVRIVQC